MSKVWSAWTTQIDPATESVKVLTDVKGSVREWNPECVTVHVKARRGVRPVFRDAMKRIDEDEETKLAETHGSRLWESTAVNQAECKDDVYLLGVECGEEKCTWLRNKKKHRSDRTGHGRRAHEEMMMPHSPSGAEMNHTWDDPHRNWAVITMAFAAQLL